MPSFSSRLAVLLLGAGLLASPFCLTAAPRDYDIAIFEPPAGWSLAESPGHLTYTVTNAADNSWCMLAIYASRPAAGDPVADFRREWKELVQSAFEARSAPSPSAGTSAAGLSFRQGSADVRASTGPAWVDLTVFTAGGRTLSLLAVASSKAVLDGRRREQRSLLEGLRFAGVSASPMVAPVSANSTRTPASSPSREPGSFRGAGLAGVWMAMVPRGFGSYEIAPRWRVFFADGNFFNDLPDEGLAGFDHASSRAGPRAQSWGSWKIEGNAGQMQRPGERFATKIAVLNAGQIKLDSDLYTRSTDVTGLRLDGAWTSYANPDAPELERLPVGARPVIHFSRDGRFTDDGLFAAFIRSGSSAEAVRFDAPGAGSYRFSDFTLELHYTDGRVRRTAFTGLLGADPAVKNDIIFVHRSMLRRRARP
jgi:hypothetical protein